jgi:hypothetical protein
MSLFKKRNNSEETNVESNNVENVENCNEQSIQEEEWIWVEGYKGTDKNLKCKSDFQYEIGKEYNIDEVKICEKGFHFCLRDLYGT